MNALSRKVGSITLLLWLLLPGMGQAKVTAGGLFRDHMVLQQGMPIPIWGAAGPGDKVTVSFAGQSADAAADANGRWIARLPAFAASSEGRVLTVACRADSLTIQDVLVGEVWICSGQSNMTFALAWGIPNKDKVIAAADMPGLRQFGVPQAGSLTPEEAVKGTWTICSPRTAGGFSAVAFFFGRELYQRLNVPVGLIHTSYGATPAEAWTSREALDAVPELKTMAAEQIARMQAAPELQRRFPDQLAAWEEKFGCKDPENQGFKDGWAAPDLDTHDWKSVKVGFNWEAALEVKSGGVFWLRKDVDLPADAAGKPFHLALGWLPEQYHTIYFNGNEVGRMGHTPPEYYTGGRGAQVPGKLVLAGRNVIAIRFVSHTQHGGFYVPGWGMELPVADRHAVDDQWLIKAEALFPPLPPGALESQPKLDQTVIQYTSTGLYNSMIHPLIPYAIRGAIWYQGESNTGSAVQAEQYRVLFPTLIADWRQRWQQGDFPFYFVQLANLGNPPQDPNADPGSWPLLRESQLLTLSKSPHTGMAVAIDIGDAETIHPLDKQDVGQRLALWALAKDYKKGVICSGPLYQSVAIEGSAVRVRFGTDGDALMVGSKTGVEPTQEVPDGKLTWFAIAGADKKWVWADARIDGGAVLVTSPQVPSPVAVRYAWAQNPAGCNLYGKSGLPASPFRTDDWPSKK